MHEFGLGITGLSNTSSNASFLFAGFLEKLRNKHCNELGGGSTPPLPTGLVWNQILRVLWRRLVSVFAPTTCKTTSCSGYHAWNYVQRKMEGRAEDEMGGQD